VLKFIWGKALRARSQAMNSFDMQALKSKLNLRLLKIPTI
jgi:hypothetical protein